MPCIHIRTNAPSFDADELLADISAIGAEIMGKPEKYMMVLCEPAQIIKGGLSGTAALVSVMGIGGLDPAMNRALTKALCEHLNRELCIDPDRVYITFTDVPGTDWGCNGSTFG